MKAGAEFVRHFEDSLNCNQCGGNIDARGTFGGAIIPSPAQLQAWFPTRSTPTRGISRRCLRGCAPTRSASASSRISTPSRNTASGRRTTGASRDRLTLNLGLRYDLSINAWANDLGLEYKSGAPPFYRAGRPHDMNNLQPRLGFAYQVNDRTVIRGGSGTYFSDALTVDAFWPKYNTQLLRLQYTNDGRANFAADPLNGATLPTYAEAQSQLCTAPQQAANFAAWQSRGFAGTAPCILNALQEMPAPDEYMQMARSWNSSIGFQRQFGATTAHRSGLHPHDRPS